MDTLATKDRALVGGKKKVLARRSKLGRSKRKRRRKRRKLGIYGK